MSMARWMVLLALIPVMISIGCEATQEPEPQVEAAPAQPPALPPVPLPPPRDGVVPVGDVAPNFEATDHTGERRVLSDLLSKKNVVLIFYPADFTPGCTKQLCNVRDDWEDFKQRNAVVLGINPAGVDRHLDFAQTHMFPFPVLSDPGGHIAAAYGARGQDPMRPRRTVYVIRRDGRVALAKRGMVSHDEIFAALDRP